jgi:hypothetical protein
VLCAHDAWVRAQFAIGSSALAAVMGASTTTAPLPVTVIDIDAVALFSENLYDAIRVQRTYVDAQDVRDVLYARVRACVDACGDGVTAAEHARVLLVPHDERRLRVSVAVGQCDGARDHVNVPDSVYAIGTVSALY